MVLSLAWGLMVVVLVALLLNAADQSDRRKLDDMDRRVDDAFHAAMDAPEGGADPAGPRGKRPAMTNQSCRPQNGLISRDLEGVQRGSGTQSVRTMAGDGRGAPGEAWPRPRPQ